MIDGKVTGYARPVANPNVEKPIIFVKTLSAVILLASSLVVKFSTRPDEKPMQVVPGKTQHNPVL